MKLTLWMFLLAFFLCHVTSAQTTLPPSAVRVALIADPSDSISVEILRLALEESTSNVFQTFNETQWYFPANDSSTVGLAAVEVSVGDTCIRTLERKENFAGVLGPFSADTAVVCQSILQNFLVPQISTVADLRLSDKASYPTFIRIAPPSSQFTTVWLEFMKAFDWRMALPLITEDQVNLLSLQAFNVSGGGIIAPIQSVALLNDSFDFRSTLLGMVPSNLRILLIDITTLHLSLLYTAKNLGFLNSDYVWIWAEEALDDIFTAAAALNVTQEVEQMINGHIFIRKVRGYGKKYQEFSSIWKNETGFDASELDPQWLYLYDAVTTYDKVFTTMMSQGMNLYNSTLMMKILKNISFEGLTGKVSFDSNYDVVGSFEIINYVNRVQRKVGVYTNGVLNLTKDHIIWPSGYSTVPTEKGQKTVDTISTGVIVVFYVIAGILSLISVILLIVVVAKRGDIIIAHSGPIYLSLILIGSLGLLSSVYVFGENERTKYGHDSLCMLQIWMVGLSFILLFGSLFLKSFKIFWIANHPGMEGAKRVDAKIYLLLGLLLLIEMIILIVFQTVDPLTSRPRDTEANTINYICQAEAYTITIIWIVYKGVILVFGLVLAFLTKDMQKKFNESRVITFSIFNSFILSVIIVPVSFIMNTDPNVVFVIKCVGVIGISTGTIFILFSKKVWILLIKDTFTGSNSGSAIAASYDNGTKSVTSNMTAIGLSTHSPN